MLDEVNGQKFLVKLQNETIYELRAEIDQMSKETNINKLQNKTADELRNAGKNFILLRIELLKVIQILFYLIFQINT
jgi:hypothetical protein